LSRTIHPQVRLLEGFHVETSILPRRNFNTALNTKWAKSPFAEIFIHEIYSTYSHPGERVTSKQALDGESTADLHDGTTNTS